MDKKDKKTTRTLNTMIRELPTPDLNARDLKEMILQFIYESPNDKDESLYAAKANVKLNALRLLADVIKNENTGDYEAELLAILGGGGEE